MTTVVAALLISIATTFTHVRSTEPALRAAIDAGRTQSELFRALADRLDDSDVVVHLVYDNNQDPGVAAHLTFVTKSGGIRYLRIAVVSRLAGCELVALLGHELQHAAEIADAALVVDQPSMAALYERIGDRRSRDVRETFDTAEAVAAGDRIRRETLRGGRADGPDRRP